MKRGRLRGRIRNLESEAAADLARPREVMTGEEFAAKVSLDLEKAYARGWIEYHENGRGWARPTKALKAEATPHEAAAVFCACGLTKLDDVSSGYPGAWEWR